MTQTQRTFRHRRFQNLKRSEAIVAFDGFMICPIRDAASPTERDAGGTAFEPCLIEDADDFGIFGLMTVGDKIETHPVHDEHVLEEAIRLLRQIRIETGKPVYWYDPHHGAQPAVEHADGFLAVAEALTHEVLDDIADVEDEASRVNGFDNHLLAPAREAFVMFSDYGGTATAADPYRSLEEAEAAA